VILAFEEANANGGVLGRPVELIAEDNQSKHGESATIAKKFVSRDKVVAASRAASDENTHRLGRIRLGKYMRGATCRDAYNQDSGLKTSPSRHMHLRQDVIERRFHAAASIKDHVTCRSYGSAVIIPLSCGVTLVHSSSFGNLDRD
jgi:hypothetical protein